MAVDEDRIKVSFPGGMKVVADVEGHTVVTDQPPPSGNNEGPQPLSLFLVSLATCAGAYAVAFCRSRGIPIDGMSLELRAEWSPEEHRYTRMVYDLTPPEGFPEKYRRAIARAMDQCTVKRCLHNPPEFETVVR